MRNQKANAVARCSKTSFLVWLRIAEVNFKLDLPLRAAIPGIPRHWDLISSSHETRL
jgi:hypothetical protein